jgi:hypothetical protein
VPVGATVHTAIITKRETIDLLSLTDRHLSASKISHQRLRAPPTLRPMENCRNDAAFISMEKPGDVGAAYIAFLM